MLKPGRRLVPRLLAAFAMTAIFLVPAIGSASPVAAAPIAASSAATTEGSLATLRFPCAEDDLECEIEAEDPGTPGTGEDPVGGGGSGGSGPRVCSQAGEIIPCNVRDMVWSSGYNCYLDSNTAPSSTVPSPSPTAVWYNCWSTCVLEVLSRDCEGYSTSMWLEPWQAEGTMNPAVAAARVIARFALQGIDIGFAPDPGIAGSRGYVGLPVWMWVDSTSPLTYGPYDVAETEGGVFVTAHAVVSTIRWTMGDGQTVTCTGTGARYQASLGVVDSPSCGYRYRTTSSAQPGGIFTVTATSNWVVNWNANGLTGTQNVQRTSTVPLTVRELQSVNVGD